MAVARLIPLNIITPGKFGLNTQQAEQSLGLEWATEATNCIVDDSGRLSARKGWEAVTTSAISGNPSIESLGEYISIAGTSAIISAAANKIYSGTSALTERTGTITPPTDDNWKFMNFNNKVIGMQADHTPIVGAGGAFADIVAGTGTLPTGHACLSAFGRLWATKSTTDKTTLVYCSLLDETLWGSGSAGSLDLKTVWAHGIDEITALAEFQGKLLIFGKRSVLIYTGASTPSTMTLADHITGVGCIARDSVQDVGTDIFFLSDSGLRSLVRTVQNETAPINDITFNIRDYFRSLVGAETVALIRSVYHEIDGFYLISLPTAGLVFCVNLKQQTDNSLPVVTLWDGMNPKAFLSARNGSLYIGRNGVVGKITNVYRDNTSTYNWSCAFAWTDFGEMVASRIKIPKKMILTLAGGYGYTITARWAYDFNSFYTTQSNNVNTTSGGGTLSEYNIAEYGIAEYGSSDDTFSNSTSYLTKSGKNLKFGYSAIIDQQPLKIQRIEILAKLGRL